MEQSHIKVLKEHPPLLDTLKLYEQFLIKLLGMHGHNLKLDRVLHQEVVSASGIHILLIILQSLQRLE